MTAPADPGDWAFEVRPRRMRQWAWAAAIALALGHLIAALLMKVKASGVTFQVADQVALVLLGLIAAGAILLFTRPRLRGGPAGLALRNVFGERLIPWSQVVGVSFPQDKHWARIDLPGDEYLPVMAIQQIDREHAVAAMTALRELVERYRVTQPAD